MGVHYSYVFLQRTHDSRRIIAVVAAERFWAVNGYGVGVQILLRDEELSALRTRKVADVTMFFHVIVKTAFPDCREVALITLQNCKVRLPESDLYLVATEYVIYIGKKLIH